MELVGEPRIVGNVESRRRGAVPERVEWSRGDGHMRQLLVLSIDYSQLLDELLQDSAKKQFY